MLTILADHDQHRDEHAMPELTIHPLPETVAPADLAGGVVVVIDVLRATTVIVHALTHGARAVVPAASIDEARSLASRWPVGERLLGGERHGVTIEGFNLDNSPYSYTPDVVSGKTIVFTTTNGTRAMRWASQADEILVGAFTNLTAISRHLLRETRPVHLLCAGTDQRLSAEDLLLAGGIADRLQDCFQIHCESQIFQEFYQQHGVQAVERLHTLRASAGGRNLVELGFDRDIERASQVDLSTLVPRLDRATGELKPL
jgi:2-phosphosulfolactate phosphatase